MACPLGFRRTIQLQWLTGCPRWIVLVGLGIPYGLDGLESFWWIKAGNHRMAFLYSTAQCLDYPGIQASTLSGSGPIFKPKRIEQSILSCYSSLLNIMNLFLVGSPQKDFSDFPNKKIQFAAGLGPSAPEAAREVVSATAPPEQGDGCSERKNEATTCPAWVPGYPDSLYIQWEISRILKWRYVSVPYDWPYFGGISPYIGLKNRPYIWYVPPF